MSKALSFFKIFVIKVFNFNYFIMTESELINFIEEKHVSVGDVLSFFYNYCILGSYMQRITGKVLSKELIKGGKEIQTPYGSVFLPEQINYLVLQDVRMGDAIAVSAQYVSDISIERKCSLNKDTYYQILLKKNIATEDSISIIDIDDRYPPIEAIMVNPNLQLDPDGDEFFLAFHNFEVQMFFLQSISDIIKT